MEQWEKDYREKLEQEVKPGMYDLSTPGMTLWTGKGGYIDFAVAIQKEVRKFNIKHDKL